MAHKNLLTDRKILEKIQYLENRKFTVCRSKKTPFTKEGAEVSRQLVSKKEQIKLYIYKCRICKAWHLTKLPQ